MNFGVAIGMELRAHLPVKSTAGALGGHYGATGKNLTTTRVLYGWKQVNKNLYVQTPCSIRLMMPISCLARSGESM